MGTVASQGGALLVAGAAAEIMPPALVIAGSGGLGALMAGFLALRWRHMSTTLGHTQVPATSAAPAPRTETRAPRPPHSIPASRCRPQLTRRPAHPAQAPIAHLTCNRASSPVPAHRDHAVRLLTRPRNPRGPMTVSPRSPQPS
jgi:hypothetical protein